jgi:hypothetical protein
VKVGAVDQDAANAGVAQFAEVIFCGGSSRIPSELVGPFRCWVAPAAQLRLREIWIDEALGGASRRGRGALSQRRIPACDAAAINGVNLEANRVIRIVGLSPNWHGGRPDHCNHQDRRSEHAHQKLLVDALKPVHGVNFRQEVRLDSESPFRGDTPSWFGRFDVCRPAGNVVRRASQNAGLLDHAREVRDFLVVDRRQLRRCRIVGMLGPLRMVRKCRAHQTAGAGLAQRADLP